MMQRIINTMFHGSGKARIFLWSVFIMILATICMTVVALATGSSVFGVGAVICGVATLVTSQSMSLQEMEKKQKKQQKEHRLTKEIVAARQREQDAIDSGSPMDSKEKEQAKARYLASMNEKKLKQLLKQHKVKQHHIFVMIDSFPKEHIKETPAVMWQTDHHIHLLLMNHTSKEITVAFEDIKGIMYRKNVEADREKDYASFRYSNFISKMYQKYLPEYQEQNQNGEIICYKNLFVIEPGISFTNTSMKGVIQILHNVPFLVDDSINTSPHHDEYFKEIYRYSILCKNNIFTLEEYRQRMEGVLEELVKAPITAQQFAKTLRDLNQYHLITSDYITRYSQIYLEARKKQEG